MSCTHADACPLFPKLNASLSGWRDAYCDSDRGWRHCARYNRSLSGASVPLALLPNGKYAHALARPDAPAGRFEGAPASRPATDPSSPFERTPAAAASTGRAVEDDPFAGYGDDYGSVFGSRPAPGRAAVRRGPADRDLPDLTTALPLVLPGARRANGRPGEVATAGGPLFGGDRAVAVAPAPETPRASADGGADTAPPGWWARLVGWMRSPV
jgi:hypothetical protein